MTDVTVFLLNYAVSLDKDGDGTQSNTQVVWPCISLYILAYYLSTPGDGGPAKKNGGKPGLYNSLVQNIDVGVRNDQMLKVTAVKFKL